MTPKAKGPRSTAALLAELRDWGRLIQCWCDGRHRNLGGCPRTAFYRDVRELRASLKKGRR